MKRISPSIISDHSYIESPEAIFIRGMKLFEQSKFHQAFELFEKSSKSSYPPSFLMMGLFFTNDVTLGQKNNKKVTYYHNLSAQYSSFFKKRITDPVIIYCKGYYWELVKNNMAKAVKYYEVSAELGYSISQYTLAKAYENAVGKKRDVQQSVKYCQLAADQGFSLAQNDMGMAYENREGVEVDFAKAAQYYQLAAEQGCSWGQYNIGRCYEGGIGVVEDVNLAVNFYQRSAENGNAYAHYSMGQCYESGYGIGQDFGLAIQYYCISFNRGFDGAKDTILRITQKILL